MNTKPEWHKLVEDNQKWIHYLIRKFYPRLNISLEYEEAVAEANLALVKAAKAYMKVGKVGEGLGFDLYSRRAILNAVKKMYRYHFASIRDNKRNRHSDLALDEREALYSREYVNSIDNRDYCNKLLERTLMDKRTKEILKMYYWDSLSYNEIATKMNVTTNVVKNELYYARSLLREAKCQLK